MGWKKPGVLRFQHLALLEAVAPFVGFLHVTSLLISGGTAKDSKRGGTSLEQFIRHGSRKAEIRLVLSNEGAYAYKPGVFGFATISYYSPLQLL